MSRYVLCLHCLYLTLFPSSLLVCNVGLWERQLQVNATVNLTKWFLLTKIACIQGFLPMVPILNSKFMEWLCYMLDWSWSLLRACWIDFTLLFFYGDWTKVSLHIFMCFLPCEKSHLLHTPPWLLLNSDIIFTWLQNLIVKHI